MVRTVRTFRVAVAGLGAISTVWLKAFETREDVEVVALVDPATAQAEAQRAAFGLDCPVLSDLATAIAAERADLVVNLTPPRAPPGDRRGGDRRRLRRRRREAADPGPGRGGRARPVGADRRTDGCGDAEPPCPPRRPRDARGRRRGRDRDGGRHLVRHVPLAPLSEHVRRRDRQPLASRHGDPPLRCGACDHRSGRRHRAGARVELTDVLDVGRGGRDGGLRALERLRLLVPRVVGRRGSRDLLRRNVAGVRHEGHVRLGRCRPSSASKPWSAGRAVRARRRSTWKDDRRRVRRSERPHARGLRRSSTRFRQARRRRPSPPTTS